MSKPFFRDFEVINENGDSIVKFETRTGIEVNDDHGWIAFNAQLPNGIYYLIYSGKEPRQIPIYVFRHWHTQFFMTLDHEPLFGTIRIFLSERREFNPYEETYKYIDILLDKLQNGDYNLNHKLIERVAYDKFESPMLGLICSYIYLKSKDVTNDSLFKIVVQNLQRLILKDNVESPDLRALNILASQHFPNYTYQKGSVQGTPIFRVGFETILKASVEDKELIHEYGINDYISENLYFDSPFNTFKPIPSQKEALNEKKIFEESVKAKVDMVGYREIKSKPLGRSPIKKVKSSKKSKPVSDIYSTSIKDLFDSKLLGYIQRSDESESEKSWVKSSITDMIKTNKNITIKDISTNIGVSGSTVNRIFNEWNIKAKIKSGK